MRWSTLIGVCLGGTTVVAVVVAVQLWSLDAGSSPANGEKLDTPATDKTDVASSPGSLEKPAPVKSDRSHEPSGKEVRGTTNPPDDTSGRNVARAVESSNLPQAGSDMSTYEDGSATTSVRGNIGDLTFNRRPATKAVASGIDATQIVVTSHDGEKFEFASKGGQPVVVTRDLDDGLYKWRAVHKPELDSRVRQQLLAARRDGDLEKQHELVRKFRAQGLFPTKEEISNNVQTGTFRVRGGQLVDSSTAEDDADSVTVQ